MNILMFGGSGIISSEICKLAVNRNYIVTIFNRGRRKEEINPNANLVIGDLLNEDINLIRKKLAPYYDVIIDFVSRNPSQLKKTLDISKDRCEQFIFISSATVYNATEMKKPYQEKDAFGDSDWNYAHLKAECEKYLSKQKLPCKYTIIRPYVTYGHTRIPLQIAPLEYYTILNRIKRNKPVAICGNDTKCTLTNATDFAVAACGLFLNPKAYGETFHITGDYVTTWEHVINCIASSVKKDVNIIDIPKEFLRSHKNEFGIEVDEILYDKGRDMIFDNSKIKSVVPEFKQFRSLEQSMGEILAYFDDPKHQVVNYFWDAGCDRMIEVYSRKKHISISGIDMDSYGEALTKEQKKLYKANRSRFGLFLYRLNRKFKNK